MKKTTALKTMITQPEIVLLPGAYDAFLARCVQQAGFKAVYMTGAGVSHSRLGTPDLGLLSFSEMVDQAWRIADAVDLPVLADADTGYGNSGNVTRTIKAYEKAGVAGCHIEDQLLPKRCGHFDEKRVVSLADMTHKLSAALDARTDGDFAIIARTDSRTALGLPQALDRACAFAELGVDMVFVESPVSIDELAEIGRVVKAPLLANMVETGKTPLLPAAQLQALGYSAVIYPGALGRFLSKQVLEFLATLMRDGTTANRLTDMLDFADQNEIVGLSDHLRTAERYKAVDSE